MPNNPYNNAMSHKKESNLNKLSAVRLDDGGWYGKTSLSQYYQIYMMPRLRSGTI